MEITFSRPSLQLEALEHIARNRRAGCIQSDLARLMGQQPRNFFYVVKV